MKLHVLKKIARQRWAASFCALLALSASPASAQTVPNSSEIFARANKAYYNLKRAGLLKLTRTVAPNYELMMADLRKLNSTGADARVKSYSQIQLELTLGAQGDTLVKRIDAAGASLTGVANNISQTVSSFFQMWGPNVFGTPFSKATDNYQLDDLAAQYRISYVDEPAKVVTTMDKDMTITAQIITAPGVNTVLWPQFMTTPQGLLPTRFDNDWRVPGKGTPVHVSTTITYQELSGLQFPKTFRNRTISDTGTIDFEVAFTSCTVSKR